MKQIAIAVILGVVVAIATSCRGPDDNSAAEQAAPTPQQVADVAEYLKSALHS